MLDTLDSKFLHLVITNLDVSDQVALYNTCTHLREAVKGYYSTNNVDEKNKFFRNYVKEPKKFMEYWKMISFDLQYFLLDVNHREKIILKCLFPNRKVFNFTDYMDVEEIPPNALKVLLKPKCNTLIGLGIRDIYGTGFSSLKNLRFEYLEALELSLDINEFEIDSICAMCPNLIRLILNFWSFGGTWRHKLQGIYRLPLRKLTLDSSLEFTTRLNDSESISNCQTIEELFLSWSFYKLFERDLLNLHRLYRLRIFEPFKYFSSGHMWEKMFKFLDKKTIIFRISFSSLCCFEFPHFMKKFRNFQRVDIEMDDIVCQEISLWVRNMKKLKVISIRSWTVTDWSSDLSGVLDIVEHCLSVKAFYFYGFLDSFENVLTKEVFKIVSRNLTMRDLPLIFQFNKTKYEIKSLEDLNDADSVKVSNAVIPRRNFIDTECSIEFEW